MPDLYDIDCTQAAPEILPPDKRGPRNIALLKSLMKAVQWSRDLLLGSYRLGSPAYGWSPGAYAKYSTVIYKKSVYYNLIDNNASEPGTNQTWLKVQENFLGVNERVKFNGQNLVLEYALNQRFSGRFRPPPSSTRSDIYMTNLPPVVSGFRVGLTIGSSVGQTTSPDKIGLPIPFIQVNNFEVHVKSSIYALTNDQEIRDFIDQYIPISLNYTITQY